MEKRSFGYSVKRTTAMKKILCAATVCFFILQHNQAQSAQSWQGKQCAVVLTYDDAIDEQLDNAVPVLDSLGIKATFYITASSPSIRNRMNEWKKVSESGHE